MVCRSISLVTIILKRGRGSQRRHRDRVFGLSFHESNNDKLHAASPRRSSRSVDEAGKLLETATIYLIQRHRSVRRARNAVADNSQRIAGMWLDRKMKSKGDICRFCWRYALLNPDSSYQAYFIVQSTCAVSNKLSCRLRCFGLRRAGMMTAGQVFLVDVMDNRHLCGSVDISSMVALRAATVGAR